MGQAQAIPDNLFDYSDTTTQANSDLQTWVRTVLAPAVDLYIQTAIDLGNNIADLTLSGTGRIDSDTQTQLTATANTDAHVREVGQAFEDAGDSGQGSVQLPPWLNNYQPPGDPNRYGLITTDDGTVTAEIKYVEAQQEAQQSYNDGAALAAQFNQGPVTAAMLQQLAAHENDPNFTTGFFNNLTELAFKKLMLQPYPAGSQPGLPGWHNYQDDVLAALMSALDPGTATTVTSLNPQVCNWLVDMMRLVDLGDFNQKFLAALGNDPTAAINFFNSLDDAHLQQLINGNFSGPGNSSQKEAQVINLLTEAMEFTTPPSAAAAFYQRVSAMILNSDPSDPTAVLPAAQQFFGAYISASLPPPPPGSSPAVLSAWARSVGKTVDGELQRWLTWINKFEGENQQQQTQRQALEEFVTGIIFTAIGGPMGTAASIAIGTGSSFITSYGVTWVDEQLFPLHGNVALDQASMTKAARLSTEYTAVVNLIAAGDVVGPLPDGQVGVVDLTSSEGISMVLANPTQYTIRGVQGFNTVRDLMDSIDAQFAP